MNGDDSQRDVHWRVTRYDEWNENTGARAWLRGLCRAGEGHQSDQRRKLLLVESALAMDGGG